MPAPSTGHRVAVALGWAVAALLLVLSLVFLLVGCASDQGYGLSHGASKNNFLTTATQ